MRGRRTSESPCSTEQSPKPRETDTSTSHSPGIALNVGCGSAYKPGAVNIDMSRSSAADLVADVRHLPLRDGSVDSIDADQLLEHFDTAHVRLVLSEFHRVLCKEGTLTIETPDMRRAVRRFSSAKPGRRDAELQWMFGLDSPGLQHMTGFTRESLISLLDESSFQAVTFEKPRTHLYEPGLRAICRRREQAPPRTKVVAEALRALTLDEAFDDSFVLVPLQEELSRYSSQPRTDDAGLVSRACVLNPEVALAVVAALRSEGSGLTDRQVEIVNTLAERSLHERAFALWRKSVRVRGDDEEFQEFIDRLTTDVEKSLADGDIERLMYVLSLDPVPIRILEHRLAMVHGQRAAGLGLRMYTSERHREAVEAFTDALATNPSDFCSAMNLARLVANHGELSAAAGEAYRRAVDLAPHHLRRSTEREAREFEDSGHSPDMPFMV